MQPPLRQPVSHRRVWIGLTALAVFVLGVFVVGYWVLVRYDDKVARHVPNEAIAALRLDVEQVVLYEPIRKHVFPVVDGAKTNAARLAKLKEATGVNLGMDLREIMVAVLPQGRYVAAVGGLFPTSDLLRKTLTVLPSDHGCTLTGARLACPLVGGSVWFEQAQDGVVVMSNSEGWLDAALVPNDQSQARWELGQAPIALGAAWEHALADLPVSLSVLGLPEWLSELRSVFLSADLGDPLAVQLELQGLTASRTESVRSWLQQLQALAGLVRGPDVAGEREAFARATVESTPEGGVALRTQWQRKDVDRAARAFADWLERLLRS